MVRKLDLPEKDARLTDLLRKHTCVDAVQSRDVVLLQRVSVVLTTKRRSQTREASTQIAQEGTQLKTNWWKTSLSSTTPVTDCTGEICAILT